MQDIKLPLQLVNSVLQYLATRPYQDVYQLVAAIQKTAKDQVPQDDKPVE